MIFHLRRVFLPMVVVLATASIAIAQAPASARVRVRSAEGAPVAGALVALLDGGGSIAAEGLSNEAGARSLSAPAGNYRVQVRRIGFRPFVSEEFTLPRTEDLVIVVSDRPIALRAVVVTARARCRSIEKDAAALSIVWEEISKALRASQLTGDDLAGIAQVRVYEKKVGRGGTVISNSSAILKSAGGRPFGAMDPRILAITGYVHGNATDGWEYFGPDETVLLSDGFASTHCFKVVRDRKRAGQIGVSFEPISGRKQADIAGVLWVDESTAELREMLFRYVNAGVISRFEAGGRTHFLRMPSGAWLVDDWHLRFPTLEMRPTGDHFVETGFVENGGGIVRDGLIPKRNVPQ